VLELLQGLTEGGAIDAQALRKLALRRELGPRRVLTTEDQRAKLFGNFLGDALLLHGLEHDPFSRA
jgi:hypothetical protein